jgi:Trk K+ transport system NAD-binding subunit
MSNPEYVANLRKSAGQLACLVLGMEDFATQILALAMSGKSIDSDALEKIRASCIVNLKNIEMVGEGVNDEAEIMGKAISDLEQTIDRTIADVRQANDRS